LFSNYLNLLQYLRSLQCLQGRFFHNHTKRLLQNFLNENSMIEHILIYLARKNKKIQYLPLFSPNDNYLLSIYNLQELDYNSRLFRRVLWKKTIFLNI